MLTTANKVVLGTNSSLVNLLKYHFNYRVIEENDDKYPSITVDTAIYVGGERNHLHLGPNAFSSDWENEKLLRSELAISQMLSYLKRFDFQFFKIECI